MLGKALFLNKAEYVVIAENEFFQIIILLSNIFILKDLKNIVTYSWNIVIYCVLVMVAKVIVQVKRNQKNENSLRFVMIKRITAY